MRTLLLAALLLPIAAHAQIASLYGTFSDVRPTNVQTGTLLTGSTFTNQFTSFNAPGFGGGITLNALNLPVVSLGLDLRGSTKPGNNGADTALAGLKLTLHPPILPIKPYVQVSGGYLATRTTNVTATTISSTTTTSGTTFANQYAMVEGIAGIDYKLIHFIDLRLIEIGYGKAFNTGINLSGDSRGADANILTINTGVVLHF